MLSVELKYTALNGRKKNEKRVVEALYSLV
jgi:hypothetical protein